MATISLELNPNKNIWPIFKMILYEGGQEYDSKANLWEAGKKAMSEIGPGEWKKKLHNQ